MTAPISNGPTTHGYTTMRDATLITYPYRNNLSAYAAGFVGMEGRHARNGLAAVPMEGFGT